MASDDKLCALRNAIDAVDDHMLELLTERARLAQHVAELKRAVGRPFYVPSRERAIIDRVQTANPGPFPARSIRPVFQEIISACRSLEGGVSVAFLGPEGTFTQQAVKRHFGVSTSAGACGSIAAVFDQVERATADFGVVPVENSSAGVVRETLESFVESPLHIHAEVVVKVDLCLCARPGVVAEQVARVYSHPQAFAQCRAWLADRLSRVLLVECSSTADAAHRAADDADGAAIAGELAARMAGLAVLHSHLQDAADNRTRFLVIGRGNYPEPSPSGDDKTVVLLVPGHDPGDLFEVLRPLGDTSRIKLTRLESRPSRRPPWEYALFVELEGHATEPRVAEAMTKLAVARRVRVLGSYRKADET